MKEERKVVSLGKSEKEEYPDLYTNSVRFSVSTYEFLFTFGLKTEKEKEPKTLLNIRMSPQHAKVMSKLLAKNVRAYEQQIGEINIPEALVKEMKLDEEV